MKVNTITHAIKLSLMSATLPMMIGTAVAEDIPAEDLYASNAVEKISVTGSRGAPRSVDDSPVPVDVLSEDDLNAVAFTDMNDVLRTLVPSYSLSRQPISDGGTFVRPASLRGLPTDKTLVLLNSHRRHRSALVEIGGSGTQGPDIATIPTIAISSVEVLRDGAAAQYGSDAIAGVINFQLRSNAEGGRATLETGQYFEGDGEQITFAANKGFALGDEGFLSISAEISDAKSTIRATQYCESWFCADASSPGYGPEADYAAFVETPSFSEAVAGMGDVVQPWGQPKTSAVRAFFNAGYEVSEALNLYAFGNYSSSEGEGNFFYRYPNNGTIENLRQEDGSIYTPLSKFPGGFTPLFSGDVIDYSFAGGAKGDLNDGWSYDVSARLGHSEIQYTLQNTINPSLGAASPTSFKPGDLINEELHIQADVFKNIDIGLDSDVLTVFGLSYLDESYEVVQGEESSYVAGPHALPDPFGFCSEGVATEAGLAVITDGSSLDCADSNDPVYTVVGVGSNGFPGFSPTFSEKYSRDSYAVYVDASADVSQDLFMQVALRYEDYSDFDSETVYKVAGLYQLSEVFAMRASLGTGFRAPTPGQQGTTNVSTRLPNGFPVATGLFPALSEVSQALGAEALRPEKSTNYTLGLTADLGDLNLTLDYYRINLEDRVNAISTLSVSTDMEAGGAYDNYLALVGAGVSGAESIGGVFYFQNAFDSVTEGLDFVATYKMASDYGDTNFTASLNYNSSEFDSDPSEYLNAEAQYDFENGSPETRAVLSVSHSFDDISVMLRTSYFGEYDNSNGSPVTEIQTFSSEWFTDLEASYQINETFSLMFGARNIFDNYPDKSTISGDTCCGRIYLSSSEVDWQGGYYYLRLAADF